MRDATVILLFLSGLVLLVLPADLADRAERESERAILADAASSAQLGRIAAPVFCTVAVYEDHPGVSSETHETQPLARIWADPGRRVPLANPFVWEIAKQPVFYVARGVQYYAVEDCR